MITTEEENRAVQCLHDFIYYFNKKDINKIISFMIKDKKNSTNKINLVLLKKIGLPISSMNFDKKHLQLFFQRQLNN